MLFFYTWCPQRGQSLFKTIGQQSAYSKISKPNFFGAKNAKLYIGDLQFGDFSGILNKDPTVWLNRAWLANTCIPLSLPA
jgi:hypothetical protein